MVISESEYRRVDTFSIPALDCPEEMALIEKWLLHHPGIADLNPLCLERRLRVTYDSRLTSSLRIAAAVSDLGWPAWVTVAEAPVEVPTQRTLRWSTTLAGVGLLLLAALAHGLGLALHVTEPSAGPALLLRFVPSRS